MIDLMEYSTVMVVFDGSTKRYTYKTDINFKVGDKAVVEARGEYKVVRVTAVHCTPRLEVNAPYAYKWIISKVDLEHYNDVLDNAGKYKAAKPLQSAREKALTELTGSTARMTSATPSLQQVSKKLPALTQKIFDHFTTREYDNYEECEGFPDQEFNQGKYT